jgi:hypothetical protein
VDYTKRIAGPVARLQGKVALKPDIMGTVGKKKTRKQFLVVENNT